MNLFYRNFYPHDFKYRSHRPTLHIFHQQNLLKIFLYLRSMSAPREILLKYWGYPEFRPMQEEIIQSVLDGNDTLALLPTGGGKSICFQVPAMLRDGICLVITPLIALMKDQVEHLKKKGIQASAIYSGMKHHEIERIYDNCASNPNYKFLYISPERLKTEMFLGSLQRMKIGLVAIDEAHCISQWGYDFRPPYLEISDIRPHTNNAPFIALTATATPQVVVDIADKLKLRQHKLFQKSFERINLAYMVFHEENKMERLLRIIKTIKGSGIVYVRNRRKTITTAKFLVENGIPADFYHAGLEQKIRDKKQDAWMYGSTQIIVSTNAFGMGIDKSNVRFVVHLDIPDSLEAYFQEAGRAGRDGKKSYAVLLYESSDIQDLKNNFENAFPEPEYIKRVYHALGNFLSIPIGGGKTISYDFDLAKFSETYNFKPLLAFNALKFIEKEGLILLTGAIESPSKILFTVSQSDLYRFQVETPSYDPFIKLILRTYSGVFTEYTRISESSISKISGLTEEKVKSSLIYLSKLKILDYTPQKNNPQIVFIEERLDQSNFYLSKESYKHRKDSAEQRLKYVLNYVQSNNKCRSMSLISYFGQKDIERCGQCDVCLSRNKAELSRYEFDSIVDKIKPLLLEKAFSITELVEMNTTYNPEKIIRTIQYLMEHNKVELTDQKKYLWIKS